MPYRTVVERDSYNDNEDSKNNMTLSQKFKSLIHTNSNTKLIAGTTMLMFPLLLSLTVGRIILVISPLVEGEDKHLVTDQFAIWMISFCLGLLFLILFSVLYVCVTSWKEITHFIVNEFFPKSDI